MSTIGDLHFTAQYFTVSSHVTWPSKQLCFVFADVRTYCRLFPLVSAKPGGLSLMFMALG